MMLQVCTTPVTFDCADLHRTHSPVLKFAILKLIERLQYCTQNAFHANVLWRKPASESVFWMKTVSVQIVMRQSMSDHIFSLETVIECELLVRNSQLEIGWKNPVGEFFG
ncbi:hypothetical protein BsWGS_04092 [Bradybaena similaris]